MVNGGASSDYDSDQPKGAVGSKYYDDIACRYDGLFLDQKSREENWIIGDLLGDYIAGKQVLDVGCGTGLLLDILDIPATHYVGIDPSGGMLRELWIKHPQHFTEQIRFEDVEDWAGEDYLTISLFGSMNYVDPDYFNQVFDELRQGKYFLMFYREGYIPVTYARAGGNGGGYDCSEYDGLIRAESIESFGDYYIVHNLDLNYENI